MINTEGDCVAEAKQEAALIIKRAEKQAVSIVNATRERAEADMRDILQRTGTWVSMAHDEPGPIVKLVQRHMCQDGRPGRKVLDFLLGAATDCYCCAAIRGFLYGVVATSLGITLVLLMSL